MAEFKTNSRSHMKSSNLHRGKALVSDYKDYQPSYMKAVTVKIPGNLATGGDKLYKSIGGASKLGNVIPVNKEKTVYQDAKPNKSNSPKPNYKASVKKDKNKKERMKLGKNTHKAAKLLMGGGTKRY